MRRLFSRYDISYLVHTLGGISIIFSVIAFSAYQNVVGLTILSTCIACNLASIYFVYFFAWNAIVYIDKDKMWKKKRDKIVEIKWTEIAEVRVSAACMRPAMLVSFISTNGSIVKIVYGKTLLNIITNLCADEDAKAKFFQAVKY